MLLVSSTTAIVTLALGIGPALAATGSVYIDGNFNVGAGHDFFGGTAPGSGSNVGLGYSVMPHLTTGYENTAIGRAALRANTQGFENTATGYFALAANRTGDFNIATGSEALHANTTGIDNVAAGTGALFNNTTGDRNIAIGDEAGSGLTTGSDNIDIAVADGGVGAESGVIRIGAKGTQKKAFLAGVSGKSISGTTAPVLINGQGQLGTAAAAAKVGNAVASGNLAGKLKRQEAQNRRQGEEIATQTKEIATLKRQMARLSRH